MVTMFIHPSGMRKSETKCMLCVRESHNNEGNLYAAGLVKDGVVFGLLPRQYQGFAHCFYVEMTELHMLSNGVILGLNSSHGRGGFRPGINCNAHAHCLGLNVEF